MMRSIFAATCFLLALAPAAVAQVNGWQPHAGATPGTPSAHISGGDANGQPVGALLDPVPPLGAVIVTPANVGSTLASPAANTTYYFEPGLYRNFSVTPAAGDTLIGARGAVLSGSVLLTGWTGSAGDYTVSAPQSSVNTDGGACDSSHPVCTQDIDVFYDGKPLTAVNSSGGLATGDFYYNSSAKTISIYDNPTGHTVETDTKSIAINGGVNNVTIENLVIAKYASAFQQGCVGGSGTTATGWTVDHVEVSLCHGYGYRMQAQSITRASYFHDNGELGLGGGGNNSDIIEGNESSWNNYAGYDCGDECGGIKFGGGLNYVIEGNNVHNDLGNDSIAIWADVDSQNWIVRDNRVHDETGPGIQIEISCQMQVLHNTVYNDGLNGTASATIAEIYIPASHDVDVAGNAVTTGSSDGGIIVSSQNRGSGNCGNHVNTNVFVHDNLIALSNTSNYVEGLWTDYSANTTIFNASSHNTFYNNRLEVTNTGNSVFTAYNGSDSGTCTFSSWQSGSCGGTTITGGEDAGPSNNTGTASNNGSTISQLQSAPAFP